MREGGEVGTGEECVDGVNGDAGGVNGMAGL